MTSLDDATHHFLCRARDVEEQEAPHGPDAIEERHGICHMLQDVGSDHECELRLLESIR